MIGFSGLMQIIFYFSTPQAFIDATNPNNLPLSLSVHEFRDCVYEEMTACQCFGKDASGRMEAQ
jgi:hypothetical protein